MAVLINDDELNNLVLNDTWVKDYIYGRDLSTYLVNIIHSC